MIDKMIKMGIFHFNSSSIQDFSSAAEEPVVDINGVKSRPFYLNNGLPQESEISPLLLLLFINDITEHTKDEATPRLFAMAIAILAPITRQYGLQAPGTKERQSRICKRTSMASVSGQRN